jgi:hypothetical protein
MSRRARNVAVTILVVVIILTLAYLLRSLLSPHPPQLPEPKNSPVSQAPNVADETIKANAHPVHKGGVHSLTELFRLINSDPAVAAHYRAQGFRPECASTMILAANTWARVSYRENSGFAWTRTPVLLLAGEGLIVDCEGHIIRMGCANLVMLADISPQPDTGEFSGDLVAPGELVPADIGSPVAPVPIDTPPITPPVIPIVGPSPDTPFVPVPIICCFGGGSSPVPPVAVVTPENPTWIMMAVSMLGILLLNRFTGGPRR